MTAAGYTHLVMDARQTYILDQIHQARNQLLAAVEGLETKSLSTEIIVGNWTAKDILGHVVSWGDEFNADAEAILGGRHPGYEHVIRADDDFNEWNQAQAATKRAWTWRRMHADFDRYCHATTRFIERLQPGDLRKRGVTPWIRAAVSHPASLSRTDTESVETLMKFHYRHMFDHARMLERWSRARSRKRA